MSLYIFRFKFQRHPEEIGADAENWMSDIYGECMIIDRYMLEEHNVSHHLLELKEKRDNNRKERADGNSPDIRGIRVRGRERIASRK